MIVPTSISEQLLFTTVRIKTTLSSGVESVGTGFFFDFMVDKSKTPAVILPTIITNKHVVRDAVTASFQLHTGVEKGGRNVPSGFFSNITLSEFKDGWHDHPNPDVDLCAMMVQPLKEDVQRKSGAPVFYKALDESFILPQSKLEELSAVEDVLMAGYPIGLWDAVNNLPLIRRGITATHPAIDYEGKSITAIDAPCFPGSSGSPVVFANEGMYSTKKGTVMGGRVALMGVLFGGPQIALDGSVSIQEIPTVKQGIGNPSMMAINLGYVIKAREILTLGEMLKSKINDQGI